MIRDEATRWQRLESLFHEALEKTASARERFVTERCADDPELHRELRGLLAAHDAPDPGFDDPPATAEPEAAPRHAPRLTQHGVVGRYRIVRLIGAGGMGAVYEAVQDSPPRTVALKVLSALSPEAARRFEHEAVLLGRLRHPGIAQVYDAGVVQAEGRITPYIAMELVPDARPLVRYADEAGLDTHARLALFARVCDAVQHAHAKGVIHRDLKPANILVDPAGTPQVIDFGVARAVGEGGNGATMFTGAHTLLGTIAYMSPEQCDPAGDADVRADVYALGVVLYELLGGALPYRVDSVPLPEAGRIIREQPPRRLSAIRPLLRGDLETIALKALEKERERRYQSVADLAEDVRRFLAHRPIAARPPSALYLARRFARRNRVLVAAGAGVLAAVIAGAAVSAAFAVRARAEARRAERVNEFLLGALGSANPMVPATARDPQSRRARLGAPPASTIPPEYEPFADWHRTPWPFAGPPGRAAAAADVLRAAGRRLETDLADDPVAQARLADALGITLFRLRQPAEAERLLRLAAALRSEALGPDHEETLRSLLHLAEVLDNVNTDESGRIFRDVRDICRRRYGVTDARTMHVERMLANNLFYLHGRRDEALRMLAASVSDGATAPAVLEQATYASHLYTDAGRLDEAERLARRAADGLGAALGRDDIRTAEALDGLSYVLWQRPGGADEAERCAREALAIKARVFGEGSMQVTKSRLSLANGLADAGRYGAAADEFLIGVREFEQLLGDDDFETLRARGWAADALAREGTRLDEARRLALAAADGLERPLGPSTTNTYPLAYRGIAADVLARTGDARGAAREWDAIARQARLFVRPDLRPYAAGFLARSARAQAAAGEVEKAREHAAEAISIDPSREAEFRAMVEEAGVSLERPG